MVPNLLLPKSWMLHVGCYLLGLAASEELIGIGEQFVDCGDRGHEHLVERVVGA